MTHPSTCRCQQQPQHESHYDDLHLFVALLDDASNSVFLLSDVGETTKKAYFLSIFGRLLQVICNVDRCHLLVVASTMSEPCNI